MMPGGYGSEFMVSRHLMANAFASIRGIGLRSCTLPKVATKGATSSRHRCALDDGRWNDADGSRNRNRQTRTRFRTAAGRKSGLLTCPIVSPDAADVRRCLKAQGHSTFVCGTFEAVMRSDFAGGVDADVFALTAPPRSRAYGDTVSTIMTGGARQVQFCSQRIDERNKSLAVGKAGGAQGNAGFHTCSFVRDPDRVRLHIAEIVALEPVRGDLRILTKTIAMSQLNAPTLTFQRSGIVDPMRPSRPAMNDDPEAPFGAECQCPGSARSIKVIEG